VFVATTRGVLINFNAVHDLEQRKRAVPKKLDRGYEDYLENGGVYGTSFGTGCS
jgi:hypothetical protein